MCGGGEGGEGGEGGAGRGGAGWRRDSILTSHSLFCTITRNGFNKKKEKKKKKKKKKKKRTCFHLCFPFREGS